MHDTRAYEAETDGIVVRVRPSYLAGQSDPDASRWVWAYQVEIVNLTGVSVQLMARHWVITDARGQVEEVRGPGVIGEQPTNDDVRMIGRGNEITTAEFVETFCGHERGEDQP